MVKQWPRGLCFVPTASFSGGLYRAVSEILESHGFLILWNPGKWRQVMENPGKLALCTDKIFVTSFSNTIGSCHISYSGMHILGFVGHGICLIWSWKSHGILQHKKCTNPVFCYCDCAEKCFSALRYMYVVLEAQDWLINGVSFYWDQASASIFPADIIIIIFNYHYDFHLFIYVFDYLSALSRRNLRFLQVQTNNYVVLLLLSVFPRAKRMQNIKHVPSIAAFN